MKKLKFTGLIILLILSITAIGCTSQDNSKTTANNTKNNTVETNKNNTKNNTSKKYQNTPEAQKILEENQEENNEKDKRYKKIDKATLDYNTTYSSSTYYETEDCFAGSHADIPAIDNKKYKEILKDYTYASEVNPTKVTYEDAIKLAKSVLPYDIKEIRKKYDSATTKTYIVYSSEQGNFIVGFAYDYKESHTDGFIPTDTKNIVVGIDYMKEIN